MSLCRIIGGSKSPFQKSFNAKAHGAEKTKAAGPIGHYCSRIYPTYFEPLKNSDLNLLEIGVAEGNSLRMWRDYFLKANIYGLEIISSKYFEESRIKVFIGDQNSEKDLENIKLQIPVLDIIIDDGSHLSPHQIKSFESLFPHLSPGGLYIIEDLFLTYKNGWGGNEGVARGWGKSGTIVEYLKRQLDNVISDRKNCIDYIHFYQSLVVIRKKE